MVMLDRLFLIILLVKIVVAIAASLILADVIRLGDSDDYIQSLYLDRKDWLSPAYVLSLLSYYTGGNRIILNIFAAILSSVGVFLALRSIETNRLSRYILIVILLSPSFTLWSSIYSKESFVVLFSGLMIWTMAKYTTGTAVKKRLYFTVGLLSLCLLIYFKRYYSPIFLFVFVTFFLVGVRRHLWLRQSYIPIVIMSCFLILVFYGISIGHYLAIHIPPHFNVDGSMTRLSTGWDSASGFWLGILQDPMVGIIGPTLIEAAANMMYFSVFIESWILVILVLVLIFRNLTANVYSLFCVIFAITIVVFLQYVFGYLNAGSAIRYRTDILLFVSVYIVFMFDRQTRK